MSRRLVIAGGGEHARVVSEAAAAAGWEPIGCTGPDTASADAPAADAAPANAAAVGTRADLLPATGLPWVGTDAELAASLDSMPAHDRPWLVLGVGGPPPTRRRIVAAFGPEARWATVIHPAAWVSPSASIGPGTVVLARAVVNTGAALGAHVIVNSGAVVEHDVLVGDHAHVGPGAAVGGGARIGPDALIALGASVRDHVAIGGGAVVGMGAAAVADVADGIRVVGVPARPVAAPAPGGRAR